MWSCFAGLYLIECVNVANSRKWLSLHVISLCITRTVFVFEYLCSDFCGRPGFAHLIASHKARERWREWKLVSKAGKGKNGIQKSVCVLVTVCNKGLWRTGSLQSRANWLEACELQKTGYVCNVSFICLHSRSLFFSGDWLHTLTHSFFLS